MRLTKIEDWTRRNRYRMEPKECKIYRDELYRSLKVMDEVLNIKQGA